MRTHIEGKIRAAQIDNSPFPHLVIEDFFPADIYGKILEYNPFKANVGEEWLSKAESGSVSSRTPYHARKHINFHMGQQFDAPAEQQAFWSDLKGCFLDDDWFPELVAGKFADIFRFRFGDLVDESDFVSLFRRELFLQRHEPGYYIGPHTDIPTRVFTCIFSFASEPGFDRFGTELLVPNERLDRCWGNDHYGPERFTVKKVAPYKPNNFLLFLKPRQSFHSVQAIDDSVPNQRYGMQFQFYEPPAGLFNDLSSPDIMRVQRPKHLQPTLVQRAVRKLVSAA